jgi:hypothetical protein
MAEVLSPYSRIFSDVNNELMSLVDAGNLQTKQERDNFIKNKGVDLSAFREAQKKYFTLQAEGKGDAVDLPYTAAVRVGLGALGKVGEAVESVGETFAPETTERIKKSINLPESVERKRQELFFPSQGGFIEQAATEIGSYIIPGTAAFKGLSLGAKGLKLANASKKAKIGKGVLSFAGATTFIEKPEDNFVNMIADEVIPNEEGKPIGTVGQIVEKLKVNPDDTASAQYLKAFVNNLVIEGAFIGAGAGVIKAASKLPMKDFIKYVTTGVKKGFENITPTQLKEYGTSRMGLNDKALELIVKQKNSAKEAISEAQGMALALKQAINKELPKSIRTEQTMKMLNAGLAGDKKVLKDFERYGNAPETVKAIKGMRNAIDTLSKDVKEDAIGKLNITIGNNLETYLNRSFQIFDDPNYLKNIPDDVKEEALKYFRGLKGKNNKRLLTDEEIETVYKHYTEGMTQGERGAHIKGISARANKILTKRKDIPVEIRNLWGEVKDPYKNFVNTYTKLANVVAEQKFKKEIVEEAIKAKKATRESIPGFKKIAENAEGEETFLKSSSIGLGGIKTNLNNPLKDIFLDPTWKKAIEQGTDVDLNFGTNPLAQGIKAWMSLKAGSQAAKTIYSIPTHARNVIGNFFIMAANGTVNPMDLGRATKQSWKRFRGKLTPEDYKQLAKYQRLGIVDSSVTAESLKQSASEGFKVGPNGLIDKAITKSGLKFLNRKTLQAYEAEDNLFKIANYENLLKNYRKAFANSNMSEEALENFVAQRTRDMMPNYNLVPKALKLTRALPIGNFVAFPAEMARNAKNLAKYAWQDISGKTAKDMGITDPKAISELRKIGLKRLAGMTTVALAGDEAVERSKAIFGITDEQESALNQVVPEWEKGTNKIFLSNIKNVNGDIKVNYINMGQLDPYSYLKVPVKLLTSSIINNEDYNETAIDDMQNQALYSIIQPYVDPAMTAQAILKEYKGQGAVADEPIQNKLGRVALKSFTPGTIDFFMKRKQFLDSQKEYGEGEERTKKGFDIGSGTVNLAAFLGVKQSTANLSQGFGFNVNKPISDMNKSKEVFVNTIESYPSKSKEDIINAYKKSQRNKIKHAQRLRTILKSYRKLGFDQQDIVKSLSRGGLGSTRSYKDINLADRNIFMPDQIPKQTLKKAMDTQADIPRKEIERIQQLLYNTEID